ncbi:sigma-54-dependent Fis family transcriptional regulator [Ramlibacter henchirensis]|uniref:Sigma-54-dependent Fis family transcriptional regulator n=1 Tax=Ramlibacter henchirensis TaxID=204072 RepID=A0A4Z0BTA3_9BURK|nr:sigma-54 dependent transcriptional regulator [Ramlibacter henchirensis]TFZ02527.1 sigma-54-dependent Fis family transcriptional regulator [Ramlibacter henchirensis]
MNRSVLIIEDNATLAKNMATYLRQHGWETRTAPEAGDALTQIADSPPDVVLVDYSLPGMDGLELLRRMRVDHPDVKSIMVTGHGSVDIAVEAMKSGACDYLSKPIALSDLKLTVEKAIHGGSAVRRSEPGTAASAAGLDKLLGESAAMQMLKEQLRRLLEAEHALRDRDRPAVLIMGETGTGKELVARAIHEGGPRREGPFIELNCASIPAALIESELFGFERGAFTDARDRKRGLVELAEEGTLFLDEIGELDLPAQSKLLKLIEDRVTRRLGGVREHRSNVRIVAATNQDLERLVASGRFRGDLFFRLRIVLIRVPPLRERSGDILLLARHFVRLHGQRYGRPNMYLSPSSEDLLAGYSWPGNVRELRNCLEQAVLMAPRDEIGPERLVLSPMAAMGMNQPPPSSSQPLLPEQGVVLEEFEGTLIQQALARTKWNVTRAAKLLGLSRDTLRYRIEKLDLKPPPGRQ